MIDALPRSRRVEHMDYTQGLTPDQKSRIKRLDGLRCISAICLAAKENQSPGDYFAKMRLIRFGGHLPKGGYDVLNGGNTKPTAPSAV